MIRFGVTKIHKVVTVTGRVVKAALPAKTEELVVDDGRHPPSP